MSKRQCVFFDRDGIVNRSPGEGLYVTAWREFHLLPEFVLCLRKVLKLGYEAAIVTNQRGVAKRLMTISDLENIHNRLKKMLKRRYGLKLLDIIYCPHDKHQCSCRKPEPGMLLTMARKHRLDLRRSWLVGDSASDVEAGKRAGCRTILVGRRRGRWKPDYAVSSMRILAKKIDKLIST
jgi:D-glycero-D-manno-heptose 1,7-bisphosphate phosphatase